MADKPADRSVLEHGALGHPVRVKTGTESRNLRIYFFRNLRYWRSVRPQERRARRDELVYKRVELGGVFRIVQGPKCDLHTVSAVSLALGPPKTTDVDERARAVLPLHVIQKVQDLHVLLSAPRNFCAGHAGQG
jgi:hypothetical protein